MKFAFLVFITTCFIQLNSNWPIEGVAWASAQASDAIEADSLDAATGLKIAPGLDLVKIHCTGCHSTKLITQFKATRQGWLDRIRWMQAKQNLWDLRESEPPILDYLAKNYAPVERAERRPPLKDVKWHRLE